MEYWNTGMVECVPTFLLLAKRNKFSSQVRDTESDLVQIKPKGVTKKRVLFQDSGLDLIIFGVNLLGTYKMS